MKRLKSMLATLAMLLCTISASAEDFSVDGIYYNITDSEKLTVEITFRGSIYSDYSDEYTGNVVIPETVTYKSKTYAVTSIGNYTFYDCSRLTSVTIPNSFTSISGYAFYGCSRLTSVTIPNSVTSIGGYAFYGCSSLTTVTIPNSVTSIGDRTFYGCSGLTSITIGNSVTSIGSAAFYNCSSLTSVHISDIAAWCNIKFSGSSSNPLYYAKHLYMNGKEITKLTIPDGVTSIGNSAFSGCSSLTSITIPNSVTSIGTYAFLDCSSLTSVHISDIAAWCNIKFSDYTSNPLGCAKHLFIDEKEITELIIPDGVTSIGTYAFKNCSSLTSVTIPNSVTSIGVQAFSDCSSLTSVTIPNSVTSIGGYAFYGCSSLTSVTIPDGVTRIGDRTFSYCSSLTSITIPEGVTSIGQRAFYGCSSLTSVIIPNSVTSIGGSAFYGTAWYNNQPDGVVYAGKVAYNYKGTMPSNTSIELAEGTISIGDEAFYNCSSITTVTIPNSVTSIGDRTFYGCSGLSSITIPEGVTSIGQSAFDGCSSLTSVHISDIAAWCNIKFSGSSSNPLYYAKHLYMNGKEITELKIPDGVTSIGNYTFSGCSSLTSVTIPNSVTSIGNYAFSDCSNLTSVTIPNSVTSIGYSAFEGCSSLTSITIPDGVTSIGKYAFYNCSSLTSVKVLAETPPVAYITTFNNYDIELCVPEKSLEIYKATSPWSRFVNIISLAPPSTTSLTIGSTGCTTFSSIYNLDFSNVEGLKAYTATGYNSDNGELTLVRIKEAKAGTGLYVSGTPGTYTIPIISSTAYNSLNMFVGVNEETTISTTDGSYTNYIYTKPTGKEAGFYKVTTDRAIPAGKAYLQIPTAWLNEETASEAKAVKLMFDDGESTGIDEVNRVESKEEVIYDLQGRRVKNPSKGIYIINGKKVVR